MSVNDELTPYQQQIAYCISAGIMLAWCALMFMVVVAALYNASTGYQL